MKRDVAYLTSVVPTSGISVISASPYPQVFIALGVRDWCVNCMMHYVPQLKRSIPHTEPDCEWCQYPCTPKIWFPVVKCLNLFRRDIMTQPHLKNFPLVLPSTCIWPRKVLELPPSAFDLLSKIKRDSVFAIVRGEGRYFKKVLFHVFDNICESPWPAFNIKPFLETAWGLQKSVARKEN